MKSKTLKEKVRFIVERVEGMSDSERDAFEKIIRAGVSTGQLSDFWLKLIE
jgi:hypothetical protein